MNKKCKKCLEIKDVCEYYKHKKMGDGYLNFCKECVKKRVKNYSNTSIGKKVESKRNQSLKRKEWMRKYSRKMYKKNYKKAKCRAIFWRKFKKGTIEKLPCNKCGTKQLVEAHHPDYNKPFDVNWFCNFHHKEWHRNNTAIN